MLGAAALVLMLSAMTVLVVGVKSEARVCYFGPPPEPDPNKPGDWMKQVMREIRKRCPGGREPPPDECSSVLTHLMEGGIIQDGSITASSSWGSCCPASEVRFTSYGWIALKSDATPWVQVDLVLSKVVTGVITKGVNGWYTKVFKMAYKKQPSSDFEYVANVNGNVQVFAGNSDDDTQVTNLFDESVVATVVRIEPTDWKVSAALRLELLGCLN